MPYLVKETVSRVDKIVLEGLTLSSILFYIENSDDSE